MIRTARQFLEALSRPGPGRGRWSSPPTPTWILPACRPRGPSGWAIRAEPGATRPRIRFRPDPAATPTPDPWPAWMTVPPGGLQLEGIDLVLAAETPEGPRAAGGPPSRSGRGRPTSR